MAKVNGSENHKSPNKKPAHEIYKDLFIEQKDNELTETFISKKRGLFVELPPPEHLEPQQLDIIYSSLHEKIREKVSRDTVQTFDELLKAAKSAEESMKPVKKRIRCNFCRHAGHTADVCRKKADANGAAGDSDDDTRVRAGIRSTIKFQIDDITDVGIIGTAAASCVASYKLYLKLKARGYQFTKCRDRVNTLGSQVMDFLRLTCDVKVGGRVFPATFVVFPNAREPENLLGWPLIKHLCVDFGRDIWYFDDNPSKTFPLLKEKPRNDNVLRVGVLTFG